MPPTHTHTARPALAQAEDSGPVPGPALGIWPVCTGRGGTSHASVRSRCALRDRADATVLTKPVSLLPPTEKQKGAPVRQSAAVTSSSRNFSATVIPLRARLVSPLPAGRPHAPSEAVALPLGVLHAPSGRAPRTWDSPARLPVGACARLLCCLSLAATVPAVLAGRVTDPAALSLMN